MLSGDQRGWVEVSAVGGKRNGIAAGSGDHPDAGFGFVCLKRGGVDLVGDPLGVGAELGVVDGLDAEVVVDGDGAGASMIGREQEGRS